jgi:GT2 family glycosyltransferase
MAAVPTVAVAVVSWNTRDLLRDCLRSLQADHERGDAEVWVVDNGSSDGSPEMVAEEFAWVRLHADGINHGFGPAVNLVAGQTEAPWIAPANSDIELAPDALRRLLAAAERDPRAAAVAPRLVLPDGSTQHSVYRFPTLPTLALFNLGIQHLAGSVGERLLLEGYWDPSRPRTVDWAVGAFLIVRRDVFQAVGGFAEWQWMYAEDVDLAWRIAEAGRTTRYEPTAEVRHVTSAATSQAWGDQRIERWQRATYAWMLRRRGPLRTRTAAAIGMAGSAARAALMTPGALVRPARWRGPRDASLRWMRMHRDGFEPLADLADHAPGHAADEAVRRNR